MGVSLVIPNRNNARYLRQCLESALDQTMPFEEIIVVDDSSDDDSTEVIRSIVMENPKVRLITCVQRVGVSRARHAGIVAARSSHVTTLDADDFFWSREKNAREWELIEQARNQARPVVAFSDIRRVSVTGEDRGSVAARRAVREGDVFRWLLGLYGFVPRDFTCARDTYFAAGGYDPEFSLYEDWDLKLRLARICDYRFTYGDGVAYRDNPSGLSRAALGLHFSAMRRIVWKNSSHLDSSVRFFVRCHTLWRVGWFHRGNVKSLLMGRMRWRQA